MTTEVSDAFITQFERDVHHAYQRWGSRMRNTIRTKTAVKGNKVTFQKAGTGNAGSKSRHGQVPIMNTSRDPVECTLQDRYAGDYVDELDTLKVGHDEHDTVMQTVVGALGRDTDDIILTEMDNASTSIPAATWSAASAPLAHMEIFGKADVPFDGNLYFVVCWECWADLLDIDEFDRMEYVGANDLWHKGVTSKHWLGINWFPHSGLPVDGSNDRKQFLYHRTAVGHGIGKDLSTDVTWQGKEQAWLIVGKMSHGAKIIDQIGIREVIYDV